MKKILSISVVALLAMAPTMGWAAEPAVAENQTGFNKNMVTSNISGASADVADTTYITDRTSNNSSNLTATTTSGESYKKMGDNGVRPIVDPANPKYNVVAITENDGNRVSAVSFVKGAYNDLITKVNRVAEETSGGNITVYTTWGSESETQSITIQ